MSQQKFSITGKALENLIANASCYSIIAVTVFSALTIYLLVHYNPKFIQNKDTQHPSAGWLTGSVFAVGVVMCIAIYLIISQGYYGKYVTNLYKMLS